jgi:hypothetical protein
MPSATVSIKSALTLECPELLRNRLDVQLAWWCVSSCDFSTTQLRRTTRKMSGSVLNVIYPERWSERGRLIVWRPWQSDLTSMNFLSPPLWTSEGGRSCRLSEISGQDLKQLRQWSMPTCEGVFGRMPRGALASALKWAEALSTTYYNCEKHRVWSLIAYAIWRWRVCWELNVTVHMLYNISDTFSWESDYGDVCEFLSNLYICSLSQSWIPPHWTDLKYVRLSICRYRLWSATSSHSKCFPNIRLMVATEVGIYKSTSILSCRKWH